MFFFQFQVENVAKKTEKPLICVDINNANQTHEIDFKESSIYQNLIFNPDLYQNQMDQPVMMLYLPGIFAYIFSKGHMI